MFWYIYSRKFTKYLNGTWSIFNILMIFCKKYKFIILTHTVYFRLLLQIKLCCLWLVVIWGRSIPVERADLSEQHQRKGSDREAQSFESQHPWVTETQAKASLAFNRVHRLAQRSRLTCRVHLSWIFLSDPPQQSRYPETPSRPWTLWLRVCTSPPHQKTQTPPRPLSCLTDTQRQTAFNILINLHQ